MARPRQVSDEDILDAARETFLAEGPSASTSRIAELVGLSQASLFKRFGTKHNLMIRALLPNDGPPAFVSLLAGGPDERPIPDQLQRIAKGTLAFFKTLVPAMAVLKSAGLDPKDLFARWETPPPVLAVRALERWFREAADRGRIHCPDPEATAISFLGMMQVRAFWTHVAGKRFSAQPDDQYVAAVIDQLWRGLAPDEVNG